MTDWADIAHQAVHVHKAVQKPAELADLLALCAERDVRRVLEVGSDAGGTLWAWSQLGAETFAVTMPDGPFSTGRKLNPHGATVVEGDSRQRTTWLAMHHALAGRDVDMLFIDGDHTAEGVGADVAGYSGFVRPGALITLHDICPHPSRPDVGVHELWADLAKRSGAREIIHPPGTWGGIGVVSG